MNYTEKIGEQYKNWNNGDTIIFDGGTGSGKTYFIINTLAKYARANNQKILYLCNRTYLKEQIETDIFINNIDNITVLNYQKLDKTLTENGNIDNFDYVIADECHYFLSDSTFNIYSDLSYNWVSNNKTITIYMSATGNSIFNIIKKDKKFIEYKIPTNYSYVDNLIFYDKKHLEIIIKDILDNTDDKIIYFCNSLTRAKKLYSKYKDISNFIASKHNKSNAEYNQDCIKQYSQDLITFDKRILITNMALDNGINIIDGKIKHIISDIFDLDIMQQCLGRKRIINNHRVNFYIRNYKARELNLFANITNKEIEPVRLFQFHKNEFLEKYSNKRSFSNNTMYYDWKIDKWQINNIRYQKLMNDLNNINKMIYQTNYETEVIITLGDTIKNIKSYNAIEQQKNKTELEEYLEKLANDNIRLFKEEKRELINKIDLRDYQNRQQKSYTLFNIYLKENKIPYIIKPKKTNIENKSIRYWEVINN